MIAGRRIPAKARKRVALDEIRRARSVETEVDPGEVAASQNPVDPSAHRPISERTGPGSAGGTRYATRFSQSLFTSRE